jgi:hypothetical protein
VSNSYEALARYKKATALASVLRRMGCSGSDALRLHPDDWLKASKAARVNPPSALTIQEVARILDETPDPFAVLEKSYEADLVRSA